MATLVIIVGCVGSQASAERWPDCRSRFRETVEFAS